MTRGVITTTTTLSFSMLVAECISWLTSRHAWVFSSFALFFIAVFVMPLKWQEVVNFEGVQLFWLAAVKRLEPKFLCT